MAIQFQQSARKRDCSILNITNLTESEARAWVYKIRWGEGQNPVCPDCLVRDDHYFIPTRNQWTCKNCSHRFSLTSSTALACRKLSFVKLLLLIYLFAGSTQALSANEVQGFLGCTLKTAFHNIGKMREAIMEAVDRRQLEGLVHIDCGHFCGKPRRPRVKKHADSFIVNNKLRNRKHAIVPTKNAHPEPWNVLKRKNRRILLVMAQKDTTHENSTGFNRVKTFVIWNENAKTVEDLVLKHVAPGSKIWTDDGSAFKGLGKLGYDHETVCHSREYMTESGVHNNYAENFVGRVRRVEFGGHNGMRTPYFAMYVAEQAWRHETKNMTMMEKFEDVLSKLLNKESSKAFCNYNHGHRLGFEYIHDFFPVH